MTETEPRSTVDGLPAPAPVTLAPAGWRHELRAVGVVWRREMIRFVRDKGRIVASLLQPLLFLFVMGTGLSSIVDTGGNIDFTTFLFPGILAMSVIFTATFSGISLVWDREFGFLREMLVAPIGRGPIILGKCLGGATTATVQSVTLLVLAGLVGVPYDLGLMVGLLALLFLAAMMLTAMGLVLSVRIRQIQAAMPLSQLFIMPMMFLSGALFPLSGLPAWLSVLTKVNPLTYVVQPMRGLVFSHMDLSAAAQQRLGTTISWWGWEVPLAVELVLVVAVIVTLLGAAMALFDRTA